MSPLPSRGSSTLQRAAHNWADWLRHLCDLRGPQHFKVADKIRSGPQKGGLATAPLPSRRSPTLQCGGQNQQWPTKGWIGSGTLAVWGVPNASKRGQNQKRPRSGQIGYVTIAIRGVPQRFKAGNKISSGPQKGGLATARLWFGGSPTLQRGGKDQKWPSKGRISSVTPTVNVSDKISIGPQKGRLATTPLPYGGSPTLQRGRQNQKWPTSGRISFVTPAV